MFSLGALTSCHPGRGPDLIMTESRNPFRVKPAQRSRLAWRDAPLGRDDSVICGRTATARRDAGYTLVELLVVVAILGLLTLIATPFVLKYLDSAKVSTARTEIANISAGLDLFKIDVGRYPTTEEGLDALMKAPQGVDNWNGPYMKKVTGLKDPWGRAYLYRSPGQHGEFDIYSYGAKGEASASGDKPQVANW